MSKKTLLSFLAGTLIFFSGCNKPDNSGPITMRQGIDKDGNIALACKEGENEFLFVGESLNHILNKKEYVRIIMTPRGEGYSELIGIPSSNTNHRVYGYYKYAKKGTELYNLVSQSDATTNIQNRSEYIPPLPYLHNN